MKHFIVIDMQKDFVSGKLANERAVPVIPKIKEALEKARKDGDSIIFTRDTHFSNYLQTNEGKHLPVEHCIKDSDGWQIVDELKPLDDELIIDKLHFGFDEWDQYVKAGDIVNICGTVTSICVASNVSALKMIDDVEVNVLADCCIDLSDEGHQAALTVMKAQHANIV